MKKPLPVIGFALILFVMSCATSCSEQTKPVTEMEFNDGPFKFKYYSDWKIDTADTKRMFNDDSTFYLALVSPEGDNAWIAFHLYNHAKDEKQFLENKLATGNGKVDYFTNWGRYKGHGAKVIRDIDIIGGGMEPGECKIFVMSTDSTCFSIVYRFLEDDRDKLLPGFLLVEKTFEIQ